MFQAAETGNICGNIWGIGGNIVSGNICGNIWKHKSYNMLKQLKISSNCVGNIFLFLQNVSNPPFGGWKHETFHRI